MKKILFLTWAFLLFCCKNRKINFYEGYICDLQKNPIENLKVYGKDDLYIFSYTNEKGYFKMEKTDNWIEHFLMIERDNIIIDSIQIVRTSGGERLNYYFVEGRSDTLFIDMSKYEK